MSFIINRIAVETSSWALPLYWKPAAGLFFLLLPILNYVFIAIRSHIRARSTKDGRNPPELPYLTPVFGHLFSVIRNPYRFLERVIDTYGIGVPVKVKIGPWNFYVLSTPEVFMSITKTSLHLTPKPTTAMSMQNIFGMRGKAALIWKRDDSGIAPNPLPASTVSHTERIWYHESAAARKYLSGNSLRIISQKFIDYLTEDIECDDRIGTDWIELPDLIDFSKEIIFRAAIKALFGPNIVRLNPNFTRDFWDYIEAIPVLLMGYPRWMAPKSYGARDRVLNGIKKWHRFAVEHSDPAKLDDDWDEIWGSQYLRARYNFRHVIDDIDADAHASNDLALMVAANANATVSTAWFLLEALRDSALITQLQEGFNVARQPGPKARFDIEKLSSQALLQSMYAEILRLRIGLLLNRTSQFNEARIGPWKFPKNEPIGISAMHCGANPRLWNSHKPLDKFWAQRFIVYPGDERSGPWSEAKRAQLEPNEKDINIKEPRFTLTGMSGAWMPYGAGEHMCPGRFLAKQEIIGGSAIFLANYEVDLLVHDGWVPTPDMTNFGTGAIPPADKVPVRIRRKKL